MPCRMPCCISRISIALRSRTAARYGKLFGDEAHYLKDKREAVIKRPRFIYYDKKDEAAETSAEAAHIFLNEKELERLELEGRCPGRDEGLRTDFGIGQLCTRQGADLVTEPTRVVGDGISIEGASMEVELEDKKIRMVRDVKMNKIEPEKLANKKSQTANRPRIGG